MKHIKTSADLKEEILSLEIRLANDREAVKRHFKDFTHSISPANVIRRTVRNLGSGPEFKGDLVNMAMSLGAGFLSRKLAVGSTRNPLKNIMGALLQAGVTNLVSRNADSLKSLGINLLSKLLSGKKTSKQEESAYQDVQ
jgi:hypothetical protein